MSVSGSVIGLRVLISSTLLSVRVSLLYLCSLDSYRRHLLYSVVILRMYITHALDRFVFRFHRGAYSSLHGDLVFCIEYFS